MGKYVVSWGLLAVVSTSVWAQAHAQEARQGLPVRKPGLWEITFFDAPSEATPARPVTVQQCTSAAVDTQMQLATFAGKENCRLPEYAASDGAESHHVKVACFVHGARADTAIAFTGDFQQSYQGQYETRTRSLNMLQKQDANVRSQRFEAKWLRQCGPDQAPGDMVLPNGITVNLIPSQEGEAAAVE